MSGHTPGRWRIGAGFQCLVDSDEGIIARTDVSVFHGDQSARDAQNRANARLIAAAPDLLAACKEALLGCTDEFIPPILRAAISKAEGK